MGVWSLLLRLVLPPLLSLAAAGACAQELGADQARHLLDRLGYGPRPGEVERVRALGAAAWVDGQLAPPAMPRGLAARLPDDSLEGRLLRAAASPRQLEEVLTAFWTGYFGLASGDALRPHVFGPWAALRAAAVRAPAKQGRVDERHAAVKALAREFLSAPSPALLRALEDSWEASGGDQSVVLRRLFTHPDFLSPAEIGTKRKDDLRFVVSAVRASGVVVEDAAPLAHILAAGALDRPAFVTRLLAGQLVLATVPGLERKAASAPPVRGVEDGAGSIVSPGPVLNVAPTPSAAAMAAARRRPAKVGELEALLRSEGFRFY